MERHDSAKHARRHLDRAERANLSADQHIAIAAAYAHLALAEELNRHSLITADAANITKSQHLKH